MTAQTKKIPIPIRDTMVEDAAMVAAALEAETLNLWRAASQLPGRSILLDIPTGRR